MLQKLAKIISTLLHPFLSGAVFFIYLIVFKEKLDIYQLGFIILLDFLIPCLFISYLFKKKIISDLDISDVTKRKYFYFPSLILLLFTLPLFLVFRIPLNLILIQLGLLIWIIFWAVISLFYKISGHTGGASFIYTTVFFILGQSFWPIFLFLPLLAWSRVKLKQHTIGQTITGSVLGFLISYLVFKVLNVG